MVAFRRDLRLWTGDFVAPAPHVLLRRVGNVYWQRYSRDLNPSNVLGHTELFDMSVFTRGLYSLGPHIAHREKTEQGRKGREEDRRKYFTSVVEVSEVKVHAQHQNTNSNFRAMSIVFRQFQSSGSISANKCSLSCLYPCNPTGVVPE